jgi:hypothetical protein
MPIIDNELVGEGVVNTDGLFHPSRYVPSVTGENIVQKIRENVTLHGEITWMVSLSFEKYYFKETIALRYFVISGN